MTVYQYYDFYNPKIKFSKEFKQLRNDLGVTQKKLSAMTNIPYHSITTWEQGYRKPAKYLQPLILAYMLQLIKEKQETDIFVD